MKLSNINRQLPVVALLVAMSLAAGSIPSWAGDSSSRQMSGRHVLTDKQAMKLMTKAETRADHLALVAYFDSKAIAFDRDAKLHSELAEVYGVTGGVAMGGKTSGAGNLTRTPEHCRALAQSFRQAAESYRALSAEHKAMSSAATK